MADETLTPMPSSAHLDPQQALRDALGAYGECCYNLEFWQERKAAAAQAVAAARANAQNVPSK